MPTKFQHLQLATIDQHLTKIRICERPADGWICTIRKSLGMSAKQLATRIGISQQSTSRLEANEIHDTITLKTLRKAAESMDCKLVYAFIPQNGSLQDIVRKQALKKAKEIFDPVDHSMLIEAQSVGNKEQKIEQLADELLSNLNSKFWN